MRRLLVAGIILALAVLYLGVLIGESGAWASVRTSVRAQITGRLPLREWEAFSPARFRYGMWRFLPSRKDEAVLFHAIDQDGIKAFELNLDLIPSGVGTNLAGVESDFQLAVRVHYRDGMHDFAFPAWKLVALAEDEIAGYRSIKFAIPIDPAHQVIGVYLELKGSSLSEMAWIDIEINRAELILR